MNEPIQQLRAPHGAKSSMMVPLLLPIKRAVLQESKRQKKSQALLINDLLASALGVEMEGGKIVT